MSCLRHSRWQRNSRNCPEAKVQEKKERATAEGCIRRGLLLGETPSPRAGPEERESQDRGQAELVGTERAIAFMQFLPRLFPAVILYSLDVSGYSMAGLPPGGHADVTMYHRLDLKGDVGLGFSSGLQTAAACTSLPYPKTSAGLGDKRVTKRGRGMQGAERSGQRLCTPVQKRAECGGQCHSAGQRTPWPRPAFLNQAPVKALLALPQALCWPNSWVCRTDHVASDFQTRTSPPAGAIPTCPDLPSSSLCCYLRSRATNHGLMPASTSRSAGLRC